MANEATCTITEIQGQHSRARRVAFVLMEGSERVNALRAFKRLRKNEELTLRSRFDHWISGVPIYKKYFHGWDKSQYEGKYDKCFVFKLREERFYGIR